jgi:flagellar motility protein MotE (MotC chaperone)
VNVNLDGKSMAEISLKRKIEILDAEIEKLKAEIEGATTSIEKANLGVAEETFRQQAFKEAGIHRPSSKLKEHEETLRVIQATLAKAQHDLKALTEFRERLVQSEALSSTSPE